MHSGRNEPLQALPRCNVWSWAGFIELVNHVVLASIFAAPVWSLDSATDGASAAPARAPDDDAVAFGRAAKGDEQAWQQLFDRWKKPLLAFFYRSLGSMAEAEDLTLEVFVRLHRAADRYEPRAAFSTYLFHIAHNLLLNELRRRRRKPARPMPPEAFDYLEETAAGNPRRLAEWEEEFQRALAELPEAQRTLLLLVQQQGLEQAEAAAVLGITENALRVQLHRARQNLKQLMSFPS